MKKILSFLLAAIMIFGSLFCMTAFAEETPKTDALLSSLSDKKEISVTLTGGDTFFGTSTDKFCIKGNNAAYEYETGFITVRAVIKDGAAYAYLPFLPFFYVKLDNTGLGNLDIWQLIKTATGLTMGITHYEESFEETLEGKTYYVEQYNDGAQVKLKFYYEGNSLKLLNVKDSKTGSVQNTFFEDISFTVSDDMFAEPKGLNLTPLLKSLFLTLINSAIV